VANGGDHLTKVRHASPAVPPSGTQELFTNFVLGDYVGIEQHSEEGCSRKRPVTPLSLGRFRFWGSVGKPVAMEHVFPVVCFCIARQMLTNSMSALQRAWQKASSPLAVG